MLRDGIVADVQAYNSLINAYSKIGDTVRAVAVLKEMELSGVRPTIVTFNTLIDSCARSGNMTTLRSISEQIRHWRMRPNYRTYSSLIHACCQVGDLETGFKHLGAMLEEGLVPTEITYSALLHGCGTAGDIKRAFELLEVMRSKGITPNVVTLSSIIHACGKVGQLDLAFTLYRAMLAEDSQRSRPNSITCSSLLDLCLKAGQVDRAFGVIRDMRERSIPLTEVTYTSLITELTRLGQLDRILEVVIGEPDEGTPPNPPQRRYENAVFPTSAKTIQRDQGSSGKASSSSSSSAGGDVDVDVEGSLPEWLRDSPHVAMDLMRLLREAERVDESLDAVQDVLQTSGALDDILQSLEASSGRACLKSAEELLAAVDLIGDLCRFTVTARADGQSPLYQRAFELLVRGYARSHNLLHIYSWLSDKTQPHHHTVLDATARETLKGLITGSLGYTELMMRVRERSGHRAVLTVYEAMKECGVKPDAHAYKTLMTSIYDNAASLPTTYDALDASRGYRGVTPSSAVFSRSLQLNTLRKQQMRHDELFR